MEREGIEIGISPRRKTLELELMPGIRLLSGEELISGVKKFVSGETIANVINFSSRFKDPIWYKRRIKKDFLPIMATLSTDPVEKSERAYSILADDMHSLSLDKSLLGDQTPIEWGIKLGFGISLRPVIALHSKIDGDTKYREANRYYKAVEAQVNKLKEKLAGFEMKDLSWYVRLVDAMTWTDLLDSFGNPFRGTDKNHIHMYKDRVIDGHLIAIEEEEDVLKTGLVKEIQDGWRRLMHGWEETQIQEILYLLPRIISGYLEWHLIVTLDRSLVDFSKKKLNSRERVNLSLDSKGIALLLKWKWPEFFDRQQHSIDLSYFRDLELESNLELPSFSVPRKYLPTVAISLIGELAKRNDKAGFKELAAEIERMAVSEKDIVAPWFVSLTAIKASNPKFGDLIDEAVGQSDGLPQRAKDIFLNKQSERIWITPDGRLRFTDQETKLENAFSIYLSYKGKEKEELFEKDQLAETKVEKVQEEKNKIQAQKILSMPFLKEVALVENNEIGNLILRIFEKNKAPNENNLLDEYTKLVNKWNPKNSKEFLYLCNLNLSDRHFREAKEMGIEALYLKGDKAVFVLGKEFVLADFEDKTFQIGLTGALGKNGELVIEGMENRFIGSKEHLFLNNLVLHGHVQTFLNTTGILSDFDKNVIQALNRTTAGWNRSSSRGLLPKIERITDNPYIVVRIEGYKEPVLVGEK